MVGDALIAAVDDHIDGAHEVAAECAAALRVRDWTGDDELANQLEAALGMSATPMLRRLAVDLEELEGDPTYGGGRIDLWTGETWPTMIEDDASDEADDPDRWLYVGCVGSRAGYRDMELFIESVADPAIADRLDIAISGRGAFRRFRDVLSRWPDEFHRYWLFSDERRRGRARDGWRMRVTSHALRAAPSNRCPTPGVHTRCPSTGAYRHRLTSAACLQKKELTRGFSAMWDCWILADPTCPNPSDCERAERQMTCVTQPHRTPR
nr:hypothetical protein [Rhodococcus wratislaviensis]GLK33699.1 hypothetical protein GCM10017611_05410 [Rhodococcus wratislaviensis]